MLVCDSKEKKASFSASKSFVFWHALVSRQLPSEAARQV